MFKDNHLAVLGIAAEVAAGQGGLAGTLLHVEVGDLDELRQALGGGGRRGDCSTT